MRADALRNRELILNAAAVVLSRDADPTLLDIAKEAGVSRATIYRHFSDVAAVREALMDEVKELGKNLLQDHLGALEEPSMALPQWMVRLVRAGLPMRTRYSEAMANEPVPDAGILASFTPMVQALIKQGQAQSEIRPELDPKIMAEALIVTGFYAARRVYRDGLPIDEAMQVFETFVRGMETSPRAG